MASKDSMQVRLHLKRVRVLEVRVDYPERLEITVKDTRSVGRCPFCGAKTSKVHETRPVEIKDLPRGSQDVTLIWMRRRFECDSCGRRHTEDHPEFEGKVTRRLARTIVRDANKMTVREVARRYGLAWHTVMTMVKTWACRLVHQRRRRRCRVLLIDETSLRRRHRYVTVIVNAETGEALGVVEHRSAKALRAFLAAQGHRWLKGVEVVVTDGSTAYQAALRTHLTHATHVVDRYHAVRWFAWGLIEVRRRVQRIGDKGERPAFEPDIFRARYALLTRADHLATARRAQLDRMFASNLDLWHAWRLLQMLYGIYQATDEDDARARIEEFVQTWAEHPLPEFKTVLKVLYQWMPEILAFHRTERVTNGRLEGVNNKLGVLKRMAYGFVNADNFASRALLLCPGAT